MAHIRPGFHLYRCPISQGHLCNWVYRGDNQPGEYNDAYVYGSLFISDDDDGIRDTSVSPLNSATPDGWLYYEYSVEDPTDADFNLTTPNASKRGEWGAEIFRDIGGQ